MTHDDTPDTSSDTSPGPTPRPVRRKSASPMSLKLAASLLLTLVIALPVAFFVTPSLIRLRMAWWLTSQNMTHRQQALSRVATHAGNDPAIRQIAIKALAVPDDINFQQIFHALDMAGQWHRPPVTTDAWFRWLNILGSDPNPEARIMAIRQTTDMMDLASDPRMTTLFHKWQVDKNVQVRYNTLVALADLAGHLKPGPTADHIQKLLSEMTPDTDSALSAEAWIFLGLLDPASGRTANWRKATQPVAAAMLWATLRTNPDHPAPAIEALTDSTVPPAVRAAAAYALHFNQSPATLQALQSVISPDDILAQSEVTARSWIAWRAVLSSAVPPPLPEVTLTAKEISRPVLWAALYQHARHDGLTDALKLWLTPEHLTSHPVSALAILEGLKPASAALGDCPPTAAPYIKLAWTRATTTPVPGPLRDLFTADSAPMRDNACVTAALCFDDKTNLELITSLLKDFNDNAKRSGAILAGLTNLRPTMTRQGKTVDLLEQKMEDEDIWSVKQIHRVGLWLQGRLPEMDQQIAGLMSRPDLPISTLLLALCHRHPTQAMNELFSPLTDPPVYKPEALNPREPADHPVTLMELLVQYRWLHVLQSALPKQHLTLSLWGDTSLQDFQLQLIRDQWLLTRPSDATAGDVSSAGSASPVDPKTPGQK